VLLQDTIDLLLLNTTGGSFEVAKLLALTNKKGEPAFGDEDKELHFKLNCKELRNIVDQSRGAAVSGDKSLLEKMLTQQAVQRKWNLLCWKKKLTESVVFAVILLLFTAVAVFRTGVGGERASVNNGFKRAFTSSFGPDGRKFPQSENGMIEFEKIASAPEALLFFEGITHEIGLAHKSERVIASPLSPRTAGAVVGNPVVKQWRDSRPGTHTHHCEVSPKIQRASGCSSSFNVSQLAFDAGIANKDYIRPSSRVDVGNQLELAHVPRELYLSNRAGSTLPGESYALVLPLSCLGGAEECVASGEESALLIRALHDSEWVDSSTRALSYEVTLRPKCAL